MPKKPLPQEEIEAITEWFIHEYWPTYPGKWCRGGKGSRSTCLRLMLEKWQPDEQERRRILGNLKAQILHDRKVPDGQRPWWKMCDTYTRNGLWEDEIESIEEPIKQELNKCKCGAEVHGPKFSECTDCLGRRTDSLPGDHRHKLRHNANLRDLNLYSPGQSLSDVTRQCKARGLKPDGGFSLAHLLKISSTNWQK